MLRSRYRSVLAKLIITGIEGVGVPSVVAIQMDSLIQPPAAREKRE
jgi:hypothetical protein